MGRIARYNAVPIPLPDASGEAKTDICSALEVRVPYPYGHRHGLAFGMDGTEIECGEPPPCPGPGTRFVMRTKCGLSPDQIAKGVSGNAS
jgi:hypothetical protein